MPVEGVHLLGGSNALAVCILKASLHTLMCHERIRGMGSLKHLQLTGGSPSPASYLVPSQVQRVYELAKDSVIRTEDQLEERGNQNDEAGTTSPALPKNLRHSDFSIFPFLKILAAIPY